MATIEQVRERQQEIHAQFNEQSVPAYRGQLTESAKQAVVSAIRASTSKRHRRKSGALPKPSKEVEAFLIRAITDDNYRWLIERLANE